MKLQWVLLIILVALCATIAVAITTGMPAEELQQEHPTFSSMLRADDGPQRYEHGRWPAWAFGSLTIAFLVGCLALGMSKGGRLAARKWVLIFGGLLFEATFVLMMIAYERYLTDDAPRLILGFPAPTAVMLFGMSTVPLVFLTVYVVMFDRWVMTPEDLDRFHRMVEAARQERGEPADG